MTRKSILHSLPKSKQTAVCMKVVNPLNRNLYVIFYVEQTIREKKKKWFSQKNLSTERKRFS